MAHPAGMSSSQTSVPTGWGFAIAPSQALSRHSCWEIQDVLHGGPHHSGLPKGRGTGPTGEVYSSVHLPYLINPGRTVPVLISPMTYHKRRHDVFCALPVDRGGHRAGMRLRLPLAVQNQIPKAHKLMREVAARTQSFQQATETITRVP